MRESEEARSFQGLHTKEKRQGNEVCLYLWKANSVIRFSFFFKDRNRIGQWLRCHTHLLRRFFTISFVQTLNWRQVFSIPRFVKRRRWLTATPVRGTLPFPRRQPFEKSQNMRQRPAQSWRSPKSEPCVKQQGLQPFTCLLVSTDAHPMAVKPPE